MFLDSIIDGLLVLTFWRFWAIVIGAGLFAAIPSFVIAFSGSHSGNSGSAAGCLMAPIMLIWPPLVLTFTILLLIPMMLNRHDGFPFDFILIFSWWDLTKITFAGIVAALIVGMIPIVGSIGTLPLFAQASTVVAVVVLMASGGQAEVWPGLVNGFGLAVVGSVVAVAAFYLMLIPVVAFAKDEAVGAIFAMPLSLMPAAIPVTFYAGWLRQANGY